MYITYIDSQGRNIIAEPVTMSSGADLVVKNPVMIAVQPQNGQLQVQLIPLFFAEFIKPNKDGDRDFIFSYSYNSVAVGSGFEVDDKIVAQYEKIISTTFKKQVEQPTKTVKLFDEV